MLVKTVATHFMADLYLCQTQAWLGPNNFSEQLRTVAGFKDIPSLNWSFQELGTEQLRICGAGLEYYILLQVFPEERFLTVDLYAWTDKVDGKELGEALIEVFSPQVVVAETRVRAEHLRE